MIELIERALERLGLRERVTRDDFINADIEDKAREADKALETLNEALHKRKETNGMLRSSISSAKQNAAFADFERMVAAREGHK